MYTPSAFAVEDSDEIVDILRRTAFGHLVTSGAAGGTSDGPIATALPFIVDDDLTCVKAHFARANRHWKSADGCAGLLIVPTVDAYISPRWYASKSEHGKVVPTWNYEVVHVHGTVEIHDETEWTSQLVRELTEQNERRTSDEDGADVWDVSDAPSDFVATKLRGIVGVQLNVARVEAKRKMSQDKPGGDRSGAARGLASSSDRKSVEAGEHMRRADPDATSI